MSSLMMDKFSLDDSSPTRLFFVTLISAKCPLCGVDRALSETMRLHGLDDFLQSIQPILTEPQTTCDNESNATPE